MIHRLTTRVKRIIIGQPNRLERRILILLFLLAIGVSLIGVFAMIRLNIRTGVSSLPYLRPVLTVVTSVWFYVLLAFLVLRRFLYHRDNHYARQASSITGIDRSSVKREKYEAKSSDGATRVIVTDEDTPDEIATRIDDALTHGEDDTLSLKELEQPEEEPETEQERERERERRVPGSSRSTRNPFAYVSIPSRKTLREFPKKVWSAFGSVKRRCKAVVRSFAYRSYRGARWVVSNTLYLLAVVVLWHLLVRYIHEYIRIGFTLDELKMAQQPEAYLVIGAGLLLLKYLLTRPLEMDDREWQEEYKLARLDFATTLNLEDIAWSLLLPAGVTIALILLAVQLWVQPWFYPPIIAIGLVVGLLNYARVNWTRSRRLESLRSDHDGISFNDLSLLVKEVATTERTTYHGFLAERRYAHDDRSEFIEELATRAYEVVQGVPVSPSVMEKQSEQLQKMQPDLHGFRDYEKEQIMRSLIDRIQNARHGLVPKAILIEDTIEPDEHTGGFDPVRFNKDYGYDPELVREAYRDLVPVALVEQEIELERDNETVTAVRLRSDPLPPEYGEIRAQFSSRFGGVATSDPFYELPDVSDKLDEEPIFTDTINPRLDQEGTL